MQPTLREQTPQERDRRYRSGIERDLIDPREITAMGEHDTVNGPVRGDGNAVYDRVNRVTQELEARNQRNLEFAGGQALAKQRWMIKFDLAGPTTDKWPGVKVFDTTNPKGCRILHSLSAG